MSVPRELDATGRPPRAARLPGGPDRARPGELAAGLGVLAVLVHLLLAQATLILAATALLTSRISRWRPLWLAVPAAVGLAWTAQIGVGPAVAGFLAGPRQLLACLSGAAGHPGRLARLGTAFAGAGHWLPRQLPLALLLAAGEAAALGWLNRGGPADYRPGLILALRRRHTVAALAAGEVVTKTGCALGLDTATGRPAEITWASAEDGVLVLAGPGPGAAALAAFPLAAAAARRRKGLIVIDLSGRPWLAGALSDTCAAAGTGLARLAPDEPDLAVRLSVAIAGRAAVLVAGQERHGPTGGTAARDALAGLRAVLDDLAEQRLRGDALAWVHGVTAADEPALAGLAALGTAAGVAVVLSTADHEAATVLAEELRVIVAAGPAWKDLETTRRGEPFLITKGVKGSDAGLLSWRDEQEFTIFERGPGGGSRLGGLLVPGPWAGQA